MGIVKKKKKIKFVEDGSVAAALQKGLVPYVDFVPLPKQNLKKIPKSEQIDFEKDRADTWANITKVAQMYYDTPGDAIDKLMQGSTQFKNTETNTYVLVARLEKDLKKTKLKLNKLIDLNLEDYCPLIGENYSNINPSKRELQKDHTKIDRKKLDRQKVINKIVMKHNRLVIHNPKKLKDWLKSNSHLV